MRGRGGKNQEKKEQTEIMRGGGARKKWEGERDRWRRGKGEGGAISDWEKSIFLKRIKDKHVC